MNQVDFFPSRGGGQGEENTTQYTSHPHPRLASPSTMPEAISSTSSSHRSTHSLPALTPIRTALLSSRFSSWYPTFRKVSPKATILDVASIQSDFFDWLEEDGLVLPRGSGAGVVGGEAEDDDDEWNDGNASHDSEEEEEEEPAVARDFSILDDKIRLIIEKYDGEVFPKLDWSAPRDAAWILPGQTLKCTTPADVYLLLKSSDFIAKDLTQLDEIKRDGNEADHAAAVLQDQMTSLTLNTSEPNQIMATPSHLNLILKRHFNFNPSHEFRCFVRANQFTAITQRDTTFYPFLQDELTQRDIRKKLLDFWTNNMFGKTTLDDYVFDVYFTRDRQRVFLVDINPYIPRTDAILWDWDELEHKAEMRWATHTDGQAVDEEVDDLSDSDTGSSASSSSSHSPSSSPPDPRGEPFIRIYTDGRPSTTHYQPHQPRPTHRLLPSLRLLTSEEQSSAAAGRGPAYATNMVPKDMIDVSSGKGVEEFARIWKEQTDKSVG